MRILVAEDDPITRRLLEKMLSDLGYETQVVTCGNECHAGGTQHLHELNEPLLGARIQTGSRFIKKDYLRRACD